MSKIIKCTLCNGKGVMTGLGMMESKCTKCAGIGHTEDKSIPSEMLIDQVETVAKEVKPVAKKRGRKPKNQA